MRGGQEGRTTKRVDAKRGGEGIESHQQRIIKERNPNAQGTEKSFRTMSFIRKLPANQRKKKPTTEHNGSIPDPVPEEENPP